MGLLEKLFSRTRYPLCAPMAGRVVSVSEIPDPAFSGGLLGKGVAVIPTDGRVYAPCDAAVDVVFTTGHAISLIADCGAQILIHVGLDSCQQTDKLFTVFVKSGQKVKQGDLLIEADLQAVKAAGINPITPMLISNASDYAAIQTYTGKDATNMDVVVELAK